MIKFTMLSCFGIHHQSDNETYGQKDKAYRSIKNHCYCFFFSMSQSYSAHCLVVCNTYITQYNMCISQYDTINNYLFIHHVKEEHQNRPHLVSESWIVIVRCIL